MLHSMWISSRASLSPQSYRLAVDGCASRTLSLSQLSNTVLELVLGLVVGKTGIRSADQGV